MFDVRAEQTETTSSMICADLSGTELRADLQADLQAEAGLHSADAGDDQPTFRTINVLLVETLGNAANASIIEQCLRYMVGFECQIAQAGSAAAAKFALQADSFDLVVTDEHSLDIVVAHTAVPTIVVATRPSSETTLKAMVAGAAHCLPLIDLSPRLLETAVKQALSDDV